MDVWQLRTPKGCPLDDSEAFAGVAFTGEYAAYTDADTWYPTWAADGHLYSPYADGAVTDRAVICDGNYLQEHDVGPPPGGGDADYTTPHTGQARIVGDDPMDLEVEDLGAEPGPAEPYEGRYPCGSLHHDGTWYYGTYTLTQGEHGAWDILGPLVGFRVSEDDGETWTETPHTPADPLFPERRLEGEMPKLGAPKFVDFGRDMEHSPDGKAYIVGHGADRPDPELNWMNGDAIYAARVDPSPETINDPDAWEFFAGREDGEGTWSGDFDDIEPLFEWRNNCGCVTATYLPGVDRYLMCVTTPRHPPLQDMDTYLLEAERLGGPWRVVHYMERFGEQGYFVNVPSKFLEDGGRRGYLCYSHNYTGDQVTNPPGGEYAMVLQEFELLARP